MNQFPNHRRLVSFMILLNRLALGVYFTLAGVHKIRGGVDQFVEKAYSRFVPGWVPDIIATPVGYAIPYVEVGVGVMMILGLFTVTVAVLMVILLIGFTVALVMAEKFFSLPGPMHPNILLLTIAGLIGMIGPGKFSLDSLRRHSR